MSDPTSHDADEPNRIHPTVALDFRIRLTLYPLFLTLYGVHAWMGGHHTWFWVLLIWETVVWPHVALRIARRSRDSKAAELRNLLIDSFVIGCAMPPTGYSLWPNAAGFLGVSAGNIAVGGPRFALKAALCFTAGVLTSALFVGFNTNLMGASPLTQVLSLAAIFIFVVVFARQTYTQSQNLRRSNRLIRTQNQQIEEKSALLEERSMDLEHAFTEAESANTAKSNFLANMSHELRTPLNSIIGFANIILRNRGGTLSPQDITYLTRITANGSHLLTLINGVLDLSKIDARQMQLDLTSVDLSELARETLSEMEPQAEARHVELVADVPDLALLTTDRARLKQILLNLLGNAVKFTPNGRVSLRVHCDPVTARPTRIDVQDTGVGIAPDRLAAVFDAFQQEDTTTSRQYGGTGLGLTITRSIAHLMGWRVTASSEPGVGSTFSVLMADDEAMVVGDDAAPTAELTGAEVQAGDGADVLRVLVIDDELDARTILQNQLEELGCEVLTAASADEGIALGRRVKPDLITLDVMMPRKNGWDALREIKGSVELRDIPVVIVSVVAREKRGRLFGAVDFIDKPVTREMLGDVIRRSVGDARRPRVLLLRDRHSDVNFYRALAHAGDMTLEVVTETDAATDAVHSTPRVPDLVVLDLARLDARTCRWVAQLREQTETVGIRIVVVADDSAVGRFAEQLDVGATMLCRGNDLAADLGTIVDGLRAKAMSNRPAA